VYFDDVDDVDNVDATRFTVDELEVIHLGYVRIAIWGNLRKGYGEVLFNEAYANCLFLLPIAENCMSANWRNSAARIRAQ
jgi:hypothetical protein